MAEAAIEKQQKASSAVSSRPTGKPCASSSGTKMSRFLAHWCRRMALSKDFKGWLRSKNSCVGRMPRAQSRKRNLRLGLATMGSMAFDNSGRSGVSLPM